MSRKRHIDLGDNDQFYRNLSSPSSSKLNGLQSFTCSFPPLPRNQGETKLFEEDLSLLLQKISLLSSDSLTNLTLQLSGAFKFKPLLVQTIQYKVLYRCTSLTKITIIARSLKRKQMVAIWKFIDIQEKLQYFQVLLKPYINEESYLTNLSSIVNCPSIFFCSLDEGQIINIFHDKRIWKCKWLVFNFDETYFGKRYTEQLLLRLILSRLIYFNLDFTHTVKNKFIAMQNQLYNKFEETTHSYFYSILPAWK